MTDDPRFDRLPKWAKSRILSQAEAVNRLQSELATARALLNEGPEDAEVIIDPYSENRQPVLNRPTVEFRYKPEEDQKYWSYFLVRLMEDNRLEIHASSTVAVYPSSGNAVKVRVDDR